MLYDLETKSKQENIVDLIRVSSLRLCNLNEVLFPLYERAVMVAEGDTKRLDKCKIIKIIENKILSDKFLNNFTDIFGYIFSHSEIKILLNYYHSQVLSKFLDTYTSTMGPLFLKFNEICTEVVNDAIRDRKIMKSIKIVEQNE